MPNTREKLIELVRDALLIYGYDSHPQRKPDEFITDHLISNCVTIPEWISVKDRLPKPFTPVLIYRKSFGTLPPYITVDKMTLWDDDTQVWTCEVATWKAVVTHWMPLPNMPQPPKGE